MLPAAHCNKCMLCSLQAAELTRESQKRAAQVGPDIGCAKECQGLHVCVFEQLLGQLRCCLQTVTGKVPAILPGGQPARGQH